MLLWSSASSTTLLHVFPFSVSFGGPSCGCEGMLQVLPHRCFSSLPFHVVLEPASLSSPCSVGWSRVVTHTHITDSDRQTELCKMRSLVLVGCVCVLLGEAALRPPAVPLVVQDPYISLWSPADTTANSTTEHWTGDTAEIAGMVAVGKQCYTWAGKVVSGCKVANQTGLTVTATKTTYTFQAGDVELTVSYRTPAVLDRDVDFTLFTLPVTFVTFEARYAGGASPVVVYFDTTASLASHEGKVRWNRTSSQGVSSMRVGTGLAFGNTKGDRINWGSLHVAWQTSASVRSSAGAPATTARGTFAAKQTVPPDSEDFRPADQSTPVFAVAVELSSTAPVTTVAVGFDEGEVAMRYYGTDFAPLWRHMSNSSSPMESVLAGAFGKLASINAKCDAFDDTVAKDLESAGGRKYAEMGALVYRQVTGSLKGVWNHVRQEPWFFMKEISSDGDVSTIDVIYPASPMLLHFSPKLFFLTMRPLMEYSANLTKDYGVDTPYNLSWAPHDLGTWPVADRPANHQEQMPVEESGNSLLMMAYAVQSDPTLRDELKNYWGLLATWADYLNASLPDPEDQLCTDDFEGPSPHNVNLAAKGIVALGAYSQLLKLQGNTTRAQQYLALAQKLASEWVDMAADNDHFRLQYNLRGTWSMKYNIVWQLLLGLPVFPDTVLEKEVNYYVNMQMQKYGVPLDNRATFTKTDWSIWSATMGTDEQFARIIDAIYDFCNNTPDRTPFTDAYDTLDAKMKFHFRARPVMGALWVKALKKFES
eukprot:Sspe_Gene.35342::Locus_17133_Transcript_1_1_Confidence_1.000_Length_3093::g.35342::m.35342